MNESLSRVSLCVLNWQNFADTHACIESLLQLPECADPGIDLQVIVIDNGSRDGSAEQLERAIASLGRKHIRLLRRPHNDGYSAGNNTGIRYALDKLNPDYIWILNNDTLALPGCLRALVDAANATPEVAIWGSTLLDRNGRTLQCAGGNYYNAWLGITRAALAGAARNTLSKSDLRKPLDYISGASMFVRRTFFAQHGLLDESYFLYYEEIDLMYRRTPEVRIDWCEHSHLLHARGASVPSRDAVLHSALSLLLFTRKHFPCRLLTVLPILIVGRSIALVLRQQHRMVPVLFQAVRRFLSMAWKPR